MSVVPVHAVLGPIIRSKIQAPVLRESTLSRGRLVERLRDVTRRRLTLLIAEAGYGKTTLMADFAVRTGTRTLWYRLDSTDGDIVTWTNHVIAALREVEPTFGQATLDLITHLPAGGPPRSAFISSVIGEMGSLEPVPTVFVLDDFHAVDAAEEALEFVVRLTRDAPPWLSVVVASRRRPTFEMGRLTAAGEVGEIGTEELRFSLDETSELFAEAYRTPLDEDVVRELDGKVNGWAASLQLFHGSIRGRPAAEARALAKALSGSTGPIYEFLAEEVLSNLSPELDQLLVRCSLLDRIEPTRVVALFGDQTPPPSLKAAQTWIEDADRLMLITRSSSETNLRQLHPLLREFLAARLSQHETPIAIEGMHLRLARALESSDGLAAAHHYVEGHDEEAAMKCLGDSIMMTMGSGRWGVASDLVDRIRGVPADASVGVIRARRLIDEGSLNEAAELLGNLSVSNSSPAVRALYRHACISLGWRTGDRDLMFSTLEDLDADDETPPILREIFQVFVDASSFAPTPIPYASLAKRLERMARTQRAAGFVYYATISIHNASVLMLTAGQVNQAIRLGREALASFSALSNNQERHSTHAILAICHLELGEGIAAEEHLRLALSSEDAEGDVFAECAYALAAVGEAARANHLLLEADELRRRGRSDVAGTLMGSFTRALLALPESPDTVLEELSAIPPAMPLDSGFDLERQMLIALAHLLADRREQAITIATAAHHSARAKGAGRTAVRLELVLAMAERSPHRLRSAVIEAAHSGALALLVLADAMSSHLDLLPQGSQELRESIARHPARWLKALRRQLNDGGTRNGIEAAKLLDEFGEASDIHRLRAFARTYRKATRGSAGLGRNLARRVAPRLEINDLGRTVLRVDQRRVELGAIRRKAAALLIYLVTRPGHAAPREQILDELWPDADPDAATNNLNQALYFLRREIDPWYEDEVSVDYIGLRGDVVWIDLDLSRVASVELVNDLRAGMTGIVDVQSARDLIDRYTGRFCPEFEYEEWAGSWRTRVHALFLEYCNRAIDAGASQGLIEASRDIALKSLDRDPTATEIERKLVWLYWRLGSHSAATAQYSHYAAAERTDGLDPVPLAGLVAAAQP